MDEERLSLINRRQRQILVHSFLYYQLNENIISDHIFDLWSKQLAKMMKTDEAKQSTYYKAFADFDGSSGFDLPYSLPEIQSKGHYLLDLHRRRLND